MDQLPVDRFMGEGVVLDLRSRQPEVISASALESGQPQVRRGDVVILCTGWGERYDSPGYMDSYPYLSKDAGHWLADRGIRLLGLDTPGPDIALPLQPPGFNFPVHRILLSRQVLLVEHLARLTPLVGKRAFVIAQPLNLRGGDGSPSRVIARATD